MSTVTNTDPHAETGDRKTPDPASALGWLDGLAEGVVIVDEDNRVSYVNRAGKALLAKQENDLAGADLAELLPGLRELPIFPLMQRSRLHAEPLRTDFFYPPLGRWIDVRISRHEGGLMLAISDITALKTSEEKLSRASGVLSGVVSAAADIVWITDAQGEFIPAEDIVRAETLDWTEFTGQSERETLGDGWLDAVHPDDRERAARAWNKTLAEGKPAISEFRLRRNDGEYRTMQDRMVPILPDNGSFAFWVGTTIDVTEQRALDDALRESERRFRATFEQAAVGVAIVAPDGRWVRVNDRLCSILGYSREELLATTFQKLTHPDDLDRDQIETDRLLNGQISTFTLDKRYIRKNGEPIWARITAAMSRKPDGSPDYFISIIQDIQAHVTAELERDLLRRQEQQTLALLDTLLSSSPNGFAFFDPAFRIVRTNRAFASISGRSIDEHLGKTLQEIAPEIAATQEQVLQQVMTTGTPVIDHEMSTGSNSDLDERRDWIVSYYPVPAIDGQILGVGATAVEITDRKRIEQKLRRSEERLRIALKSAPILMYQQDENLEYRWLYNSEALDSRAVIGRTDYDIMPKEEADFLSAAKRRVMATGIVERTKIRIETPGRVLHLDLTIEPMVNAEGKVVGVTGSAVDITTAMIREERIKRLQALTARLASAADESTVAEAIAEFGTQAVGAAIGFVTTSDVDTGALVVRASAGLSAEEQARLQGSRMPRASATIDAVESGAPLFIETWAERIGRYPEANKFKGHGEGAITALPLLIEDVPIGALAFIYRGDRSFGREERDYCSALADLCAQALERARLFDAERRAKASSEIAQRRLSILSEISGELTAVIGTEERIANVARLIVPDLADWCIVTLLEGEGRDVRVIKCLAATQAATEGLRARLNEHPILLDDDSGAGAVLRTGTPLFHADAPNSAGMLGATSFLCVPFVVRDQVWGCLSLGMSDSGRQFSAGDLALAQEISRRAAVAMDNAELFAGAQLRIQERERASARTAKLQDVTAALSKAVTVDETINAVLSHAFPAAGADRGLVLLAATEHQPRFAARLYLNEADAHVDQLQASRGRGRSPRWVESATDWDDEANRDLFGYQGQGLSSVACLPFVIAPSVAGEIVFGYSQPRTFSQEDRTFLLSMSHLIGQALDRSRAYDRERDALASASAAEARYRGLFEGSADPVIVFDRQERIQDANPAALTLLGYERQEFRSLSLSALIVDGEALIASLSSGLATAASWNGEFELRKKDGDVVPVEARAATVQMLTGSAVMITARDISERRLLEQAQQELFASISHDLKNPLAALRGQVQLLQRRLRRKGTLDQTDLQPGLETIQTVGERMSGMIDELIDVARLRGGYELQLRRSPADLVEILNRRVQEHQQATTRHRLVLTCDQPSVTGWWDASRLVRVIDNLLVNATKYSEGGEILLSLTREDGDSEPTAVFTIRDFGVGIPASDMPHIFERFRRGSNVLDRFAGTGLGLSGVRQIVEQHGGSIEIASEEGEGTEVRISLPITEEPDDPESIWIE